MTETGAPTGRSAPAWLVRPEVGLCPCGCIGKRRRASFVAKTIEGTASVVRQAIFADDVAADRGLLQRIEPRVKLVTLLGLLVATAFLRTIELLVGMYAVTLVLAVASRLPLRFFVKRVWLFVPVFTGIVVLPATLNLITPGTIVVPLGTWFGHHVGVTSAGLHAAAIIIVRVATSISLVVLLTLTTPWNRLLAALRALLVPRLLILVLAMTYRYIFLLLTSIGDMYLARRSRTAGAERDVTAGRRFVAASAGALFGKSHALSEEVYMAMVARGYTGDVRALRPSKITAADWLWVAVCLAVTATALGLDRAIG